MKQIQQPTEQNPYVVENYPYGWKKTLKRYWIEDKKGKGQRLITQTLNPKTKIWNKPKKDTYNDIEVLFLDSNLHVKSSSLSFGYDDEDCLNNFLEKFENCLSEYQKEGIKVFRAIIKTRKHVKVSIRDLKLRITGK